MSTCIMKFKICFSCSQIVFFLSLLNEVCATQSSLKDLGTNNEENDLKEIPLKLQNESLNKKEIIKDISSLHTDMSDGHLSNVSYAELPFNQDEKNRLKRSDKCSQRPPIFLLALEEVKKPGCKEKREVSQKVIPLCLYSLGKTLRKRSLVNESVVDKVIEKYFPKINERPPIKFKQRKHRRQAHSQQKLEDIGFFKQENYPLSSELMNIDELNVITEANRTLDHISKLTDCDSFEMPESMKKPLVAVLFKRISNIYSDKNKINNQ